MSIFVHIGYPKSASSTLQKQLFQKHPNINYFGLYPTKNLGKDTSEIDREARFLTDKNLKLFYKELVSAPNDQYDHQKALRLFKTSIEKSLDSSKTNLLSHERFSSALFGHRNIEEKAKRLKSIIPDAKIIIIIRNQLAIIKSQYRDWPFHPFDMRKGKPVTIKKWIKICTTHDQEIGYFSALKYDHTLEVYADLFGIENIHVLCMESLAKNKKGFARNISELLQINFEATEMLLESAHENKAISWKMNLFRQWSRRTNLFNKTGRFLNPDLKRKVLSYLGTGTGKELSYDQKSLELLKNTFSSSNQILLEKWHVPVDKYQYLL